MFCNFEGKINLKQIEKMLVLHDIYMYLCNVNHERHKKREAVTRCSSLHKSDTMKNILKYGKDYL